MWFWIISGIILAIVGLAIIVWGNVECEEEAVWWGWAITVLSVIILVVVGIVGASDNKVSKDGLFYNTPSGYEFELNSESAVNISQEFTFAEGSGGYIPYANVVVNITGHEDLSYFDAAVTFTWTYEALDDEAGTYVEKEYVATVELDAQGNGQFSNQIELSGCRACKNLKLDIDFEGYAVKK